MSTQRYDTDLTDEPYALLEPLLPRRKATGRRPADLRQVLNGILYLVRTGCQWRLLPKDFPPWSTVHTWYRRWRKDGTLERIHEALRQQVRRQAGRDPSPRSSAVDSQSVKTAGQGGEKGYDAGKKVAGRKRHIWVDSMGLLLAVLVTGADVPDAQAACDLLGGGRLGGVGPAGGRLCRQQLPSRLPAGGRLRSGAVPPARRPPAGGGPGLCPPAAALAGGAHVRLAGPLAPAVQGLRTPASLERGHDPTERDPYDATPAGAR